MTDFAEIGILVDSRDLKEAERLLGKFARAGKDSARETQQSGRKIKTAFQSVRDSANRAGQSVVSFRGIVAAIAGSAAIRAVASTVIEFEKLEASLRTVTGSAAGAQKAFDGLKAFASSTPFQLNELTQGFIKLKSLGLDPSKEALRSYGNTASAMGKSMNQVVEAVADAITGEFERLKEFGIRSSVEADQVTFTFQGVTTTVKKNAQEIESYLRGLGDVQFAGAMEEQMKTLGGAVSNMQDSFSLLAEAIGKAGLSDLFKDMAGAAAQFADDLKVLIENANDSGGALQTIRDIFGLYVFGTGSAAESTGKLLERQDELLKMEKQLIEQSKKYPATQTSNAERLKEVRKEYIKNREEIEKYYKNLKAGQGERTNQKNIEDAEAKKLKQQEDVARQKEKELQLKRIADAEEKKFRSEQTELYDKAVKQQQKEIDLYGDNTEAAKVRYETEYGLLKDILPLQKQKLIANAKEKDDLKQAEIAAEQYADTLAQMYRDGEEHDKKMADYRKKKAEEDKKAAEKQAEAMRKPYIDAVESIQGKFSDFFVDVFNGGIDSFSKLAGSIKQIFFKMIAELIAANISKAIFGGLLAGGSGVSLAGSLFGAGGSSSVSGVSGSTVGAISSATGGGAAGGSFLGGLGSSGLSAISTLLSGLSSPTLATFGFQAAQSLGLSAGASSSVASALGFAPAGAIGSFGANLLGLGGGIGGTLGGIGGSLAGGSIGASLLTGLGSAGGPVGAIIGGFLGTALGGLFGGGDPHYGGSSDIYLNSGKTLQHGSSPQASAEVAQAIQKTLAEFATAVGGKIAGGTLSIEDLSNASDYGTTRFAGTSSLINLPRTSNGQGVPMQIRGDDPKAFAEQVINELIRGGRAVGGLDSTTASLISSLSSQGKGFQEIADAVAAQKAAAEQLRETAAGAADATTSLLKPLKEFEEQAKSAGLTMAEINTYIAGQLEILNVQVGSSLLSIRQQAYQLTGLAGLESLKSDLTVGSLSQLSAQDKLAESRIALDELSKLALAGDAGASELFPAVAQQTLGLGREVFASGSGYQDIFRSVNTTLNQIIEKQQEKFSAFDISDLGLTVSETSQDQIKVLKIGFEETKEALLDIKRELAKRSA